MAAVSATVVLAVVDPNEPGHYPTCPFLAMTGWYCPGCGSMRAVHALAHGNLAGAWDMNPLLVVVGPWLVWRWCRWLLAAAGRPVRAKLAPPWVLYAAFVAIVAYWVARNVPALEPWLAP